MKKKRQRKCAAPCDKGRFSWAREPDFGVPAGRPLRELKFERHAMTRSEAGPGGHAAQCLCGFLAEAGTKMGVEVRMEAHIRRPGLPEPRLIRVNSLP